MGKLYVVAGPIGNLKDFTFRAVEVLQQVDAVYAEDTRVTKVLLDRYSISKPMRSYRESAESYRLQKTIDEVLVRLEDGESLAYLSDAGTPGISDPGNYLVRHVAKAGHEVIPIPGPSALAAVLSISGFVALRPLFVGFLPKKKGHQTMMKNMEAALAGDMCDTVVLYESPHRLVKFLEAVSKWELKTETLVGRELTKMHEEVVRGTTDEVYELFSKRTSVKGEIVIAIQRRSE